MRKRAKKYLRRHLPYLHIMQNLVDLSGESPLLEDGRERPRGGGGGGGGRGGGGG